MEYNFEELAKVGTDLKGLLTSYVADRALWEAQALKNLRQYMAEYDSDIKALIPAERSSIYPRDTRVKVKGGVAKMMEMMFPSTERNWELAVSPTPSIPKEALQAIIGVLQAQQEQQQPGVPIPSELIEREVQAFAKDRKDKMEKEIADQLSDSGIDYPQMCKRLVRSGYIYGYGVARSPMVRTQQERVWVLDPDTGEYTAKVKKVRRPYPEYVRAWDFYPDLSALTWEAQEMVFERMILSRNDFRRLSERPDFIKENIVQYLKDHTSGNYTAKNYEDELFRLAKTSNLADRKARRYEVYRALGTISAHTLRKVGLEVKEKELGDDLFVDFWFIDDVVIKAKKAPFGQRPSDQYHAFIYTEDEDSGLTGVGLPEEVRGSQMAICASSRAMMDNMSATAGPMLEVNEDLLPPKHKGIGAIHAFKVIYRRGEGIEAQYDAVKPIVTPSHIAEIREIIADQRQQLDIESNLPAFTMGGTQQPLGEAFRTSSNMSMMMGSANMVTKDTVRAFDKFTSSLLGSMLAWNMEFNPNEKLKGDYQVVAKGNLSLVSKEVRGAALDQFVTTLSPEERAILDTYGLLMDRLKSRDLPVDRVLPKEEAEQILKSMRDSAAQAAQIEQGLTTAKTENQNADTEKKRVDAQATAQTTEAVVQDLLAKVERNLATAKSEGDKNQLENLKVLLSTATQEGE